MVVKPKRGDIPDCQVGSGMYIQSISSLSVVRRSGEIYSKGGESFHLCRSPECPLTIRQSKTLPQAVAEYKRRYGRPPPRGFDQWWKFARRNNIIIVDDVCMTTYRYQVADEQYDQIHRDTEPFFALSPKLFRQRRDNLSSEPHS